MKTMNSKFTFLKPFGTLLLMLALVGGLLGVPQGMVKASAPSATDAAAVQAVVTGLDCSVSCDLYAKTGTLSLPGATVPIWGYATTPGGAAQYPGPTIEAVSGTQLHITLHNVDLPSATSLSLPYLPGVPDLTGVTAGNSKTYTFSVAAAGTYLYEAGLTPDGARQVSMGLFGAVIVRPAGQPGWAYNDPATAFDDEALVIVSEIDPAFNANPLTFSLNTFSPKYFLINGKAYPDTDGIEGRVGKRLLLRQLNGGVQQRAMAVMGLRQTVIGVDAVQHPYSYVMTSETLYAGQSRDTLVTIPAAAPTGTKYALYDAGRHFTNGVQAGQGGALTFIQVSDGVAAQPGGPLAINVGITPNPTNGASGATLNATITDLLGGGDTITQAEYFIDSLGAPGTGAPMSGTFGSVSVGVTAAIPAGTLAGLSGGEHIFYVRGLDSSAKWGLVGSVSLILDTLGPLSKTFSLTPSLTNGSADVELHSFADDTTRGSANVAAGEYFIDTPGPDGSGMPLTIDPAGVPAASMQAWIATSTILALPEGLHVISAHGQDAFGNWGPYATGTLMVDFTGPLASGVSITPNALNLSGPPPVTTVRIDATLTDALLYVDRAEAFFNTFTGNGTGFQLVPVDGLLDEMVEQVYFNVPIGQIAAFSQGTHTLYVHGRDAAGNWGDPMTATFTIDKGVTDTVGPVITNLSYTMLTPTQVRLTARAADPNNLSNIAAAEWFVGSTLPASPSSRFAMAAVDGFGFNNATVEDVFAVIDVTGWANSPYTFSVRAQDSSGNWGAPASITINLALPYAFFLPFFQH